MSAPDPEGLSLLADARAWFGVGISAVLAWLGLQKWSARRKALTDARWDSKASIKEIEEVHERITRHKKTQSEQIVKNYNAILDLYAKHESTQNKLLAAEQRSSDRFETLMAAINGKKR